MILRVCYVDNWARECELREGVTPTQPTRRIFSINLTEEQATLLAPLQIGKKGAYPQYEDIEWAQLEFTKESRQ